MTDRRQPQIRRLDAAGRQELARALGDTPQTVISTHLLRHGLCEALVVGTPSDFRAAILQARDLPGEPTAYGSDPRAIWELLRRLRGWFCVLVATECAPGLGDLLAAEMKVQVRYLDDISLLMAAPAPLIAHPWVRLLTRIDLDVLGAAPRELRQSCYHDTRHLLENGIVACAVVDGDVVATALTAARSARYADVGVFTREEYRGRGLATAAAALVCAQAQAEGQQPVWSAGAHNKASLRIAHKLGCAEIGRSRYVIVVDREATGSRA